MNKLRDFIQKFDAWRRSRKVRRAVRAVGSVADTTAAGVGALLRLAVKTVASVLLVLIVTGLLFTCIFAVYVKTCLTEGLDISLEEASLSLSSTIWYQDEYGNWQEMTKLYSQENRTWVELDNIPVDLQRAAVAIEDKRFYEHKGVDWYRTVAAFVNMFLGMKDNFGGSTLTQQLIKNLTEDDDVTVQRKLQEIFRALEFEKKYTKDEIMTWYLNEIYLGQGCYGVGSASRAYFGKDVWELNLAECASLIGITNNPSKYDLYIYPENNRIRAHTILRQMYEQDYISFEEYQEAINYEVVTASTDDDEEDSTIYTWYEETIIDDAVTDLAAARGISEAQADNLIRTGGYNIYACVDMRIQNIVDSYYQDLSRLPQPYRRSSQQLRSAIVIIEPRSGDIVALAGDVGEKKINLGLNLATEAKRPPGSSFKPLAVYAPALDTGLVNQSTAVDDSPSIRLSGTSWYPRNSGGYAGIISVHDALVNSKNTIAAQLLDKLGLATSWDYLTNRFGITSLVPNDGTKSYTDYAYAPLSLGQLSEGITVREMAQAYTAFVNEGVMSYGRSYSMITDQDGNIVLDNDTRQIYSIKANTAANMCKMMKDAVSYGTGTGAYFGSTAVGGKTGTTSDDKDRYFVGFTMYYVAAVWTGYETPERMYFSGNPACQLFRGIMREIHSGLGWWDFPSYYLNSARLKGAVPSESPSPSPSPTPACPPHEYEETGGKASCTEAALVTYTCKYCQDTYTEEVAALGHDYQITENNGADCLNGGVVTWTCSRCNDSYTEEVGPMGHDHSVQVSRTEPTCQTEGSVTYKCSRCSDTVTQSLGLGDHKWGSGSQTTAPGCESAGSTHYTCTVCGAGKDESIPAKGHSWSETGRTAPTCTADGSVSYSCSACGGTKSETLPATGHSWDGGSQTAAPGCESAGNTHYTCTVCGAGRDESIPAKGHSWSETGRTAPSCTGSGSISYSCSSCGGTKSESISPTGHSYSGGSCSVCGAADPNYVAPTDNTGG